MLLCAAVRTNLRFKIFGILRRVLILVLVVWTVVSLVTLLIELVPGDPAIAVLGDNATPEQINNFRARHGLDKPGFFFSYSDGEFKWHGADNRYLDYWKGVLTGDLGRSFKT